MLKSSLLVAASAALFASVTAAQTITVPLSGWIMNGQPCNSLVANNFNVVNPSGGGFVTGGTSASVASAPNFTVGSGTVQGFLTSGLPVTGGSSSATTCNETFSLTTGTGSAGVRAAVFSGPFVNNVIGATYKGQVTTRADFGTTLLGTRISGAATVIAVAPPAIGVLSTVPAIVNVSGSGLTTFAWGASTFGTAAGTVNAPGDGLQLNSNTNVSAVITLS